MGTAARVRIERIWQPAGGFEPRDAVARLSASGIEEAGGQDLAVCLHCDGIDIIYWVRVERIRQAGGGIQPSHAVPRLAAD